MTYELYSKKPMQMVELKPQKIIDENLLPIKSLDRSVNQALIRNCTNTPFN